jgi:class 3 adenylate cyclase
MRFAANGVYRARRQPLLGTIDAAKRELAELRRPTTVLFTDLVGSTAYKSEHGEELGAGKTFRHNDVATKAINDVEGIVVKYIGDEVMAVFSGDTGPARAIAAALKIHAELKRHNRSNRLTGSHALQTKTAIHYGTVYFLTLHGRPDPQGTVIDTAARIAKLTKKSQILCSEAVAKRAKPLPRGATCSPGVSCELRGIKGPIKIVEITGTGTKPQGIKPDEHAQKETPQILAALSKANAAEHTGNYTDAIRHYETVLHDDPRHFRANLKIARLNLRHKREYDVAEKHARIASESMSSSGGAILTRLVALWYKAKRGELMDPSQIRQHIEESVAAIALAQASYDNTAELLLVNHITVMLITLHQKTNKPSVLKEAKAYLEKLKDHRKSIEGSELPAIYDTIATVLEAVNTKQSLTEALELAELAEKMAPHLPEPSRTKGRIKERLIELAREDQHN